MTIMFITVPGATCKDCGCPINCEMLGQLTGDDFKSNLKFFCSNPNCKHHEGLITISEEDINND
jgi:hypothetical protein